MKTVLYRNPGIYQGLPGLITVTAHLLMRDDVDPKGDKFNWDDKSTSPKTVAETLTTLGSNKIVYTDPMTNTDHVIDFDLLQIEGLDKLYLKITTDFQVNGNHDAPEPNLIFK